MTSLCYKCFTPLTLKYKTQDNKKKHTTSTGITHPLGVMDEILCMTICFIKRAFN